MRLLLVTERGLWCVGGYVDVSENAELKWAMMEASNIEDT